MTKLRLPGAMVFRNINGVPLADERFWPVYEKANELSAILHIHPNHPVNVEAMTEYWLMPLVGFLMDTTLAAAHLVFAGVTERVPETLLPRHRELPRERAEAGHRLCRNGPDDGGQRLPSPDRQHPQDALEPSSARYRRVGQGGDSRGERDAVARRGGSGGLTAEDWRERHRRPQDRQPALASFEGSAPPRRPGRKPVRGV